jgi:predicted dinucleotide-binding enzyme
MKRKLKIGIIGVGNIGGVLSRHFTRLGHDVVMANHGVCMESTLCFCQ